MINAISPLEIIAVLFGVLYILLAARENSLCWYAAFISTAASILLFWDVSLIMESTLNVYYLLMAVYGWWQWQHGGEQGASLSISSWNTRQHLFALSTIIVLTLLSGYLLSRNTNAALPYLDSFTTWSAVITTWMVTRKILENWLYWIVIDSASIYLYLQRELYLYAALYTVYTVIAVFAYRQWRQNYHT